MKTKLVVVNTIFCSILYALYRADIPATAWENDILYIIPAILFCFFAGMVALRYSLNWAEWFAESTVALGLMGTAFGIWTAFSGIDASHVGDVNQIGTILGVLLSGLGAALWTTMTGVAANIWLTANIRIVEGNHA